MTVDFTLYFTTAFFCSVFCVQFSIIFHYNNRLNGLEKQLHDVSTNSTDIINSLHENYVNYSFLQKSKHQDMMDAAANEYHIASELIRTRNLIDAYTMNDGSNTWYRKSISLQQLSWLEVFLRITYPLVKNNIPDKQLLIDPTYLGIMHFENTPTTVEWLLLYHELYLILNRSEMIDSQSNSSVLIRNLNSQFDFRNLHLLSQFKYVPSALANDDRLPYAMGLFSNETNKEFLELNLRSLERIFMNLPTTSDLLYTAARNLTSTLISYTKLLIMVF